MKKLIIVLLALGFMSVTACTNTLEGIGKDIEKIGKGIQDGGKE
ncbi:MAG TPA: entericidin [Gammaproteobacteria bacterium]